MKKLLLLWTLVLGSFFTAEAQGLTCANAINITTNGTITTATFNGTYVAYCQASRTGIKAKWYRYTATTNGEVTISSNLPVNNGGPTYTNDTRVTVLSGTGTDCSALEACVATADDDAPGATPPNYLTTLTFPVQAGKTYYIQWDNYWNGTSALGFQWTFNFNAVSCIRPGENDFYLPGDYTTTGATLAWENAIGNPTSYDVDYSTNLTLAAGSGTIVPAPAGTTGTFTTAAISGLPASSNFRYYVRSNCGFTQSAWQGPYFGYLAKTGSYTHTFNAADNFEDGFIGDFTWFNSTASSNPANYADGGAGGVMYTFNSTTAASNEWGFTRGFSLPAGATITLKYKTRLFLPTGVTTAAPMSLRVTVGSDQIDTAQTTVLQTISPTGTAAYTQNTTPSWVVPADGVYYFGFNNNSAQNTNSTALFLDTIEITVAAPAGTNDVLASKFAVFPNPASNIITVSGTDALVSGIEVIDINGRTVKTFKVNGVAETQINISDLSAGVYMMNISSDKGVTTKKIVKQ